jgi:hypothetical protein
MYFITTQSAVSCTRKFECQFHNQVQSDVFVQGIVKNNTELIVEILFETRFERDSPNQVDIFWRGINKPNAPKYKSPIRACFQTADTLEGCGVVRTKSAYADYG